MNFVGNDYVGFEVQEKTEEALRHLLCHVKTPDINFQLFHRLTSKERTYVCVRAKRAGFKATVTDITSGWSSVRISRYRKDGIIDGEPRLDICLLSFKCIHSLLDGFRLRPSSLIGHCGEEMNALFCNIESQQSSCHMVQEFSYMPSCSISSNPSPFVPETSPKEIPELKEMDWAFKNLALKHAFSDRVTIIEADVSYNRSVRIPLLILQSVAKTSKPVRILHCVPERVAAIAHCNRVSMAINDMPANIAGYHVELDLKFSPCNTLLTFCTPQVLIRSLLPIKHHIFRYVTHLILDELHQNDKYMDCLLGLVRDILFLYPQVNVILMGAQLNKNRIQSYFAMKSATKIPELSPGSSKRPDIKIIYLDEITENSLKCSTAKQSSKRIEGGTEQNSIADSLIERVWCSPEIVALETFLDMVKSNRIRASYLHSKMLVPMLMPVLKWGLVTFAKLLVQLGGLCEVDGKQIENLISFAMLCSSPDEIIDLLKSSLSIKITLREQLGTFKPYFFSQSEPFSNENVDFFFVLKIVSFLHNTTDRSEGILIFLPSFEEIQILKSLIFHKDQHCFDASQDSFVIFTLHRYLPSGDEKFLLEQVPIDVRKIVLTTCLAETSITLSGIVHVIDTGKSMEVRLADMSFNKTGFKRKITWINKVAAEQRSARVGRNLLGETGLCFRLYTVSDYMSMNEQYPLQLKMQSLQELTIHLAPLLKPKTVAKFFQMCINPPALGQVDHTLNYMKCMGFLSGKNECLTILSMHLAELNIDPGLGKAILFAVVFSCLDPVLTIVSILSCSDPFVCPNKVSLMKEAEESRLAFSSDSFSDHLSYLRAFHEWEKSKAYEDGMEQMFCEDNYLNPSIFEIIYNHRSNLTASIRSCGFVCLKGPNELSSLNQNSDNWALVKAILVSALYPNICRYDSRRDIVFNMYEHVNLDTKSVLHLSLKKNSTKLPSEWILFSDIDKTPSTPIISCCTSITATALSLFGGNLAEDAFQKSAKDFDVASNFSHMMNLKLNVMHSTHDYDKAISLSSMFKNLEATKTLKIDEWITLHSSPENIALICYLRNRIYGLLCQRLRFPGSEFTSEEQATIQTVALIMKFEDINDGYKIVEGTGQWPKFVSGNLISSPKSGYVNSLAYIPDEIPKECLLLNDMKVPNNPRFFVILFQDDSFNEFVTAKASNLWFGESESFKKFHTYVKKTKDIFVFFLHVNSFKFKGFSAVLRVEKERLNTVLHLKWLKLQDISVWDVDCSSKLKNVVDVQLDAIELEIELGKRLWKAFSREPSLDAAQ